MVFKRIKRLRSFTPEAADGNKPHYLLDRQLEALTFPIWYVLDTHTKRKGFIAISVPFA